MASTGTSGTAGGSGYDAFRSQQWPAGAVEIASGDNTNNARQQQRPPLFQASSNHRMNGENNNNSNDPRRRPTQHYAHEGLEPMPSTSTVRDEPFFQANNYSNGIISSTMAVPSDATMRSSTSPMPPFEPVSSSTAAADATASSNTPASFVGDPISFCDDMTSYDDVEFIEEVEWANDDDALYGELAPRPKPDPFGDPCGCAPPDNILLQTQADPTFSIKPCCCMDPSCILFACQEECRSNCEAGPFCGNKRIQKKQWKAIQVFDAGPKGRGLKIMQDVKKGDFIIEYVGKAVRASFLSKLFQRYKQERRLYIMALDQNIYLDARKKGGVARYINHSCEPNCVVERWKVRGILRAAIFATTDIPAGTELSFDYQWERKKGRAPTKCYCGTPSCRGTLEVSKSLEEQKWDATYEGHWTAGEKNPAREIINRSIRILSREHQEYFYADVCKYDETNGKHLVIYRHDWEEVWEKLDGEDWQLLDEEVDHEFVIAKKSGRKPMNQSDNAGSRSTSPNQSNMDEGTRLLATISSRQTAGKPFLYVQTPIKEAIWAKHLVERCERSCRVTIQAQQMARPPLPPDPNNPEEVEKDKALDASKDGTVWKLTISGANVAKAVTILEKNVVYLTKKLEADQQAAVTGMGAASIMGARGLPSPGMASDTVQEVVMPRSIVEHVKRRLPHVRDKCRSVNITFAPSESKSKQFAKLKMEASLQSDLVPAREHLWTQLNAACAEANTPKAPSGFYRDLGFLGGEISGEQFRLLLQTEKDRLSQDCREDLQSSSFFASFESTQRCTLWVQSDEDKGRIDGSNHLVGEATPNAPRKIFFGCEPKDLQKLWSLVQTRAAEIARGVKFLYLGTDRVYQPFMMQDGGRFYDFVKTVTGASVMMDHMTGDHLRVDGRAHPGQMMGAIDVDNPFPESDRAVLAEELIRLQIEIYRDHCIRQQNWIFGRDWTLTKSTPGSSSAVDASSTSGSALAKATSSKVVFDEKSVANACQDIAEIVSALGLSVGVAASAAIILYRFVATQHEGADTQLKIREVLLACVFLANKSQKMTKWKRLEAVLEAAYQVFYPGARFDPSKEETVVLGEKVLVAETEILRTLDFDIFWRGVDWIMTAAVEAGRLPESLAKAALDFVCSGPILAAGSSLWLKYGVEYGFVAAAGFHEANLEFLFSSLNVIPLKVLQAAELIAESVNFNTASKRASHALLEGGKEKLLSKIPHIKDLCVKSMKLGFAQPTPQAAVSSEAEQRYRIIGGRNGRRRVIRSVPRNVVKQFILPAIDGVSAESKCNIFVGESLTDASEDVVLEGSWRAVAIAEHLLRSSLDEENAHALPPSADISAEVAVPNKNKLQAKGKPGLLSMNEIDTSDGWNETIQSRVASGGSGWGKKSGGKICVAGRVTESSLREVGLRWWIPPQHGPSPTGSICDMFLIRSNPGDLLDGLSQLARSFTGESKTFEMLTCRMPASPKKKIIDRYVAVSLQRWPSEKMETREAEKAKKKGSTLLGMGFSSAALQEMQLLTELHSLIPSPQGHPNFILPVSLALPPEEEEEENEKANEPEVTTASEAADDIFSLFRTSEENEKVARREKRRKDMVSGPHLVFQPAPFVLERFMSRKKRKRSEEIEGLSLSPVIVASWFHDLLSALAHCHTNNVVVRTIQPDQIVIDHSGMAKIGGLYRASVMSPEERQGPFNPVKAARQNKVKADDDDQASNPYAAPESLLGSPKHTRETDVWSLACLLANLLLSKHVFSGKDRGSLLVSIYKVVGAPTKDNYEQAVKFPLYSKPPKKYKRGVVKALQHIMKESETEKHAGAIDLLSQMLHLDPKKRISAVEALRHHYMLDYQENCNTKAFQERYVADWMALKSKLMKSTQSEEDEAKARERTLKRKAVLMAASKAMTADDDDLYDLNELFGREANKKQKPS